MTFISVRAHTLSLIACMTLLALSACSHTSMRQPATVIAGPALNIEGEEEEGTQRTIEMEFGESCDKSKQHEKLSDETKMILEDNYYRIQTYNALSRNSYIPKLAIAEPVPGDCPACMKTRLMYAGKSGIKTLAILTRDGRVVQIEKVHDVDVSKAASQVQKLVNELPSYENIECEVVTSGTNDSH